MRLSERLYLQTYTSRQAVQAAGEGCDGVGLVIESVAQNLGGGGW